MKYRCQPARELTSAQYDSWCELLVDRPEFDSPFFHPELTRRTALVRDDVEVGIISDGETPVGFFPFLRVPGGVAQSIPGRLSEFHGVVCEPGLNWSPDDLIQSCRLKAWYFDHLPSNQTAFDDHVWNIALSPYMDLSQGYEHYRGELKKSGSSIVQTERKQRKLEREVGPVEFHFHSTDDAAFRALLEWKSAQHARTGMLDVMRLDWVPNLLESLRQNPSPSFAGVFSVLTAAEKPIAVHFGMRTATNLHIWFPAYSIEYEKYSPGLVLLLELAKAASERGITRIDFGKSEARYKENFKSGDLTIAEGAVEHRFIAGALRRYWHHTKKWIRTSRFSDQLEFPINATRRLRQWMAFR